MTIQFLKPLTLFLALLVSLTACVPEVLHKDVISATTVTPSMTADLTSTAEFGIRRTMVAEFVTQIQDIPTITPLPPSVMKDIFSHDHANGPVLQYGENNEYFQSELITNQECVHSGQYGIRLTKKGTSEKPTSLILYRWGINFINDESDLSEYSMLVFWVKGIDGGNDFKIWYFSSFGIEQVFNSDDFVTLNTSEWYPVRLPIGILTEQHQARLGIQFDFSDSENMVICIDDIVFEQ